MDKQRTCEICSKRFPNGKATGGHMRSHLAKLPIPAKPNPRPISPNKPTESIPKSTSSSSSPSNMQTYRSVNREFFNPVVHDEDGESEAETSKNPTKRGSKRPRKTIATVDAAAPPKWHEPKSVSSVTENICSDEDVAMFLVMLSRDKWTEKGKGVGKEEVEEYVEDDSEDEDEVKDGSLLLTSDKYMCKTCKKGFASYQALGGHKSSHKRRKIQQEGSSSARRGGAGVVLGKRIFECPLCDKVFDSGQALGGHKKIHFSYLSVTKSAIKSGESFVDLNLTAPKDGSEISAV